MGNSQTPGPRGQNINRQSDIKLPNREDYAIGENIKNEDKIIEPLNITS